MAEVERGFARVDGGRIEVWLRDDGVFAVTLLPDSGGGHTYVSTEGHDGFPPAYDEEALLAWGRERWRLNRMGAD